jgi:ubiquinone/menaquinone biosynthesis C-methylase UbiE
VDHFKHVYTNRAAAYHRMIAAEDVDGNLLSTIKSLTRLSGKRVLDLGSGSGRIPLLLGNLAGHLIGLDIHSAMLNENRVQRQKCGGSWDLLQADLRRIPLPAQWADLITAGWAIGHLRSWFQGDWQGQIGQALAEMLRVVKPGGTIIVMETLGTGNTDPAPPTAELGEYYTWLEEKWGFIRRVIRTDYQFESVESAVAQTEFFFGADLAKTIQERGWARLPECTGLWVKNG